MAADEWKEIAKKIPKVREPGKFSLSAWASNKHPCEVCGEVRRGQQDTLQCPFCGRYILPTKGVLWKKQKTGCWDEVFSCCRICASFIRKETIVRCPHCAATYNQIESKGKCPYCKS